MGIWSGVASTAMEREAVLRCLGGPGSAHVRDMNLGLVTKEVCLDGMTRKAKKTRSKL